MYDVKEFDEEKLDFLRKNTLIGPIAMLKIKSARNNADKYRKWYLEHENELLEEDYSMADELEYEIRFNAYQNSLSKLWKQYGDGQGLSEFAEMIMQQNMSKEKMR